MIIIILKSFPLIRSVKFHVIDQNIETVSFSTLNATNNLNWGQTCKAHKNLALAGAKN